MKKTVVIVAKKMKIKIKENLLKGKRFTSLKTTRRYSIQSMKKQNFWSPLYMVKYYLLRMSFLILKIREWYENTETLRSKLEFLESLKKYHLKKNHWRRIIEEVSVSFVPDMKHRAQVTLEGGKSKSRVSNDNNAQVIKHYY